MKDIIEKLGIKPLERYYNPLLEQDFFSLLEIKKLEQQRNEMLEILLKTTMRADRIVERTGDKLKDHVDYPDLLKAKKIIEKATDKSWEEIKELTK